MKNIKIYNKKCFLVNLNNTVTRGLSIYFKTVVFLQIDMSRFSCWVYVKENLGMQKQKLFAKKRVYK